MKKCFLFVIAVGFLAAASVCLAEDLNQIFKKVNDYAAAGNYAKALEELSWAKKELEGMHLKKLGTMLPDQLADLTGQPAKTQSVMGITSLEKEYKGNGKTVKLTLTGGTGKAGAGGFGGLAAMGQMAAMMGGGESGMDTYRIAGRTAMLEAQPGSNNASLTIFLESGSILKLENTKSGDGESLRAMGEALKIADIDNYLKGSGSQ
jgi:hypothetical protein